MGDQRAFTGVTGNAGGSPYSVEGEAPVSSMQPPNQIEAARTGADTEHADAIQSDPVGNALVATIFGGYSAGEQGPEDVAVKDMVAGTPVTHFVTDAVVTQVSEGAAADATLSAVEKVGDGVAGAFTAGDESHRAAETPLQRPNSPESPRSHAEGLAAQRDWYELASAVVKRLASTKGTNSCFIIGEPLRPYYVQFTWSADEQTLICEAVGNGSLDAVHQLSESQQTALRNMGWHPPGRGDAARSLNFVRVFYAPGDPSVATILGVSALRTAFGESPRRVQWRSC
jgi:hypothetical protein